MVPNYDMTGYDATFHSTSLQIGSDRLRSHQIASDRFRSLQSASDRLRSFQILSDGFRSFQIGPECRVRSIRLPQIESDRSDHPRSTLTSTGLEARCFFQVVQHKSNGGCIYNYEYWGSLASLHVCFRVPGLALFLKLCVASSSATGVFVPTRRRS